MAKAGVNPVVQLTYYCKLALDANAKIYGLKFDGKETCEYALRPYDNSRSSVVFEGCEFYGFTKNVITGEGTMHMDSLVLNNCYFHDNGRAAVYFAASSDAEGTHVCDYLKVTNTTIANVSALSGAAAIDLRSNGSKEGVYNKLYVDHVTMYNVAGYERGIQSYKSTDVTITNCIIVEPADKADYLYPTYCYGGTISNILSYNTKNHRSGPTISGLIENTDPLFVDAANGDYTLGEGSPALGAGTDGSNLGDPRWWPAAPAAKDWCELEIWHFYGSAESGDPNSYAILSVIDNEDGTITFKIANDAAKNTQTFDYLLINPIGVQVGADADTGEESISGTYTLPAGVTKLENLEILWSTPGWTGRWMVQGVTIDLENDELCEPAAGPIEVSSVELTINEPKAGEALPHKTLWPTYPEFNVIGGIVLPDGAKYQIAQYTYYNSEGDTPDEDNFLPNTTYKMIALVEPLDGYSFPLNGDGEPDLANMAITINDQLITDFSSGFGLGDGIFSFEYTFTTGAIEIKDVELDVTVPQERDAVESRIYKGDALFDTFASMVTLPAGANYEIDLFNFYTEDGNFVDDNSTLAANTTYRMGINIAPKTGYAFPMEDNTSIKLDELNLTVNHNGTSYNPYNGCGYFGITVNFTTGEIPVIAIENVDLTVTFPDYGDAIVSGDYYCDENIPMQITSGDADAYYCDGVDFWVDNFDKYPETELLPQKTYRVRFYVYPKEGYTVPNTLTVDQVTVNGEQPESSDFDTDIFQDRVMFSVFFTTGEIPTGLNDIEDGVKAVKFIRDGVLYIIRDGKTYNAQGEVMR